MISGSFKIRIPVHPDLIALAGLGHKRARRMIRGQEGRQRELATACVPESGGESIASTSQPRVGRHMDVIGAERIWRMGSQSIPRRLADGLGVDSTDGWAWVGDGWGWGTGAMRRGTREGQFRAGLSSRRNEEASEEGRMEWWTFSGAPS